MRERDRHRRIQVQLEPPRKNYPQGTLQHRLQRATDETAAKLPNGIEHAFETPESSLQLELFEALHTHNFRGGVFSSQVAIDNPPLTTFKLLESPLLDQYEKFFVQEWKCQYQRGMREDNIYEYIMALDAFLKSKFCNCMASYVSLLMSNKVLRRDAVIRGMLSELPSTEITIQSEGKPPTVMTISAENPPFIEGYKGDQGGEIWFIGIGDESIPEAFEEYRQKWRVDHNIQKSPSPAGTERLNPESENESYSQESKSLGELNEILRNQPSDSETDSEGTVVGEPDSEYKNEKLDDEIAQEHTQA